MNKQRGSFYTNEEVVRLVNRLPSEIWHSSSMGVEEKQCKVQETEVHVGLTRRLPVRIRRGRTCSMFLLKALTGYKVRNGLELGQ